MRVFRLFSIFALFCCGSFIGYAQQPAALSGVEIYAPNQDSIHLSWTDASNETSYVVQSWDSATQTWSTPTTLPPNTEVFRTNDATSDPDVAKYRVAGSRSGEDPNALNWVEVEITKPTGSPNLEFTFELDQDNDLVPVDIPEGFSAQTGVSINHQVLVSGGNPDSFTARDLPSGLNFDTVNGVISGTISSPGVYRMFVGVTFDSGKQFEQVRYLRVIRGSSEGPEVALPEFSLQPQNLGVAGLLDISGLFNDPEWPFGATFETPLGFFTVALYHQATPKTVLNFLRYIETGDYDFSILHRSVPGFVIQGGGFFPASNTNPRALGQISTFPPVPNEPGISNTRGTIAMAKQGGNPDSATSQWFVSIGDNNPSKLDRQNGGFTAFGKVIGNGMAVVDSIDALNRSDVLVTIGGDDGTLLDVPLRGAPTSTPGFSDLVYIPSIRESPAVEISLLNNSNPAILSAEVLGMDLFLRSLNKIGTTNLTLRATSLNGLTTEFILPVTIDDLVGPGVRLISIRGSQIPGALLVKGRAVDNNALRSFRYRVNGKRWFNGGRLSGKDTIFKKTMRGFKVGRNRLEIEVFDSKGQSSGILNQKFTLG